MAKLLSNEQIRDLSKRKQNGETVVALAEETGLRKGYLYTILQKYEKQMKGGVKLKRAKRGPKMASIPLAPMTLGQPMTSDQVVLIVANRSQLSQVMKEVMNANRYSFL